MELFEHIRRDRRDEERHVHPWLWRTATASHRRTVRQALRAAPMSAAAASAGVSLAAPKLGPYVEIIREWLVADLSAPRKQRHTASARSGSASSMSTARRSPRRRCAPTPAACAASWSPVAQS